MLSGWRWFRFLSSIFLDAYPNDICRDLAGEKETPTSTLTKIPGPGQCDCPSFSFCLTVRLREGTTTCDEESAISPLIGCSNICSTKGNTKTLDVAHKGTQRCK
jgi:hypothetical protein